MPTSPRAKAWTRGQPGCLPDEAPTEEGADDGSEAETRGSRDRLLRVPGCRPRRGLRAEQVHGRRAQGGQQEGGREGEVLGEGDGEGPGGRRRLSQQRRGEVLHGL